MVTGTERQFDYALFVGNPNSSNYARVQSQVQALCGNKLLEDVLFVETSPELSETTAAITETVRGIDEADLGRTVLLGGGGDGTVNQIGNAILSEAGIELKLNDIPFVPMRGGNANDIARSLNGRASLAKILTKGRQTGLKPLHVSIEGGKSRYALGYFSIGGTAAAAGELDAMKGQYGATQLPHEVLTALMTTAQYPPFRYKIDPSHPFEMATDIMCLRADRIAKFGKPRTKLNADEFEFIADSSEGVASTLKKMLALGIGELRGKHLTDVHVTMATPDTAQNRRRVPVQYDGEFDLVSINSRINVMLGTHSYAALTTKL